MANDVFTNVNVAGWGGPPSDDGGTTTVSLTDRRKLVDGDDSTGFNVDGTIGEDIKLKISLPHKLRLATSNNIVIQSDDVAVMKESVDDGGTYSILTRSGTDTTTGNDNAGGSSFGFPTKDRFYEVLTSVVLTAGTIVGVRCRMSGLVSYGYGKFSIVRDDGTNWNDVWTWEPSSASDSDALCSYSPTNIDVQDGDRILLRAYRYQYGGREFHQSYGTTNDLTLAYAYQVSAVSDYVFWGRTTRTKASFTAGSDTITGWRFEFDYAINPLVAPHAIDNVNAIQIVSDPSVLKYFREIRVYAESNQAGRSKCVDGGGTTITRIVTAQPMRGCGFGAWSDILVKNDAAISATNNKAYLMCDGSQLTGADDAAKNMQAGWLRTQISTTGSDTHQHCTGWNPTTQICSRGGAEAGTWQCGAGCDGGFVADPLSLPDILAGETTTLKVRSMALANQTAEKQYSQIIIAQGNENV